MIYLNFIKVIFLGMVLSIFSLSVANGEGNSNDPLYQLLVKHLDDTRDYYSKKDDPNDPQEIEKMEWSLAESTNVYLAKRTLREYFWEEKNRYVVEEVSLSGYFAQRPDSLIFGEKKNEGGKLPMIRAIVFQADEPDVDCDLQYLSVGLLPYGGPGSNRPLRSDGPYEQYVVTFKIRGDEAEIVSCKKDETFSSEKYMADKTQRRIKSLMYNYFEEAREKKTPRLTFQSNVKTPFARPDITTKRAKRDWLKQKSAVKGTSGLRGPWEAGIDVFKKDENQDTAIPERYEIEFEYDRTQDEIKVTSCKLNKKFSEEAVSKQRIAEFVTQYLKGDEAYREKCRKGTAESAKKYREMVGNDRHFFTEFHQYDTPIKAKEGTIKFIWPITYRNIKLIEEKVWRCDTQIKHSNNFGSDYLAKHRAGQAEFGCTVVEDPDGKLYILEDTLLW